MTTRIDLEALAQKVLDATDGDLPAELAEAAEVAGLSEAGTNALAGKLGLCPIHHVDPEFCNETEGCEAGL